MPQDARHDGQSFAGLDDGRERSLEEVALEFGLTRERIRQIETEVLRKLRNPSRARGLRQYAE